MDIYHCPVQKNILNPKVFEMWEIRYAIFVTTLLFPNFFESQYCVCNVVYENTAFSQSFFTSMNRMTWKPIGQLNFTQ